jgi:2-amino-4-hydroxy-6-hydroxymethyldihydropteridine diphosphokinase
VTASPAEPSLDLDAAVVVALGSNVAGGYTSSKALLEAALESLQAAGLKIARRSRWWRSAAWPDPNGPEYRNGAALFRTDGDPQRTLETLLCIEAGFNRERGERNAPRTLDLDLIAHGRSVLHTPGLVLPHPRAHERLFVMGPLAEIAPDWRHPVLDRTAAELALEAKVGRDASPLSPERSERGRG